jgi:hypothetical protein
VLAPGDVLSGRFHVVRLLGAGGMGEVYEAFDSQLRQDIAVKTPSSGGRARSCQVTPQVLQAHNRDVCGGTISNLTHQSPNSFYFPSCRILAPRRNCFRFT